MARFIGGASPLACPVRWGGRRRRVRHGHRRPTGFGGPQMGPVRADGWATGRVGPTGSTQSGRIGFLFFEFIFNADTIP
jgi:hypothetical protein